MRFSSVSCLFHVYSVKYTCIPCTYSLVLMKQPIHMVGATLFIHNTKYCGLQICQGSVCIIGLECILSVITAHCASSHADRGDWKSGSRLCNTYKIAGVDSRGGKCRTGSKLYGTPTRDYIEKAFSYFVICPYWSYSSDWLKSARLHWNSGGPRSSILVDCYVSYDNFQHKLAIQGIVQRKTSTYVLRAKMNTSATYCQKVTVRT